MVVGIGIDVASIERFEQALDRHGERFVDRILTAGERADLVRGGRVGALNLAGRFAAKEAAAKALGGPRDVWWHDIEVRRGRRGEPLLSFSESAQTHAARLGVTRALVSITHDAGVAVAVVVLESDG